MDQLSRRLMICIGAAMTACLWGSAARGAYVTWTIQSGSSTMSGFTQSGGGAAVPIQAQGAGSLTTQLTGSFKTTTSFATSVNFGAQPTYPTAPVIADRNHPTPAELAAAAQYELNLATAVNAQNNVTSVNSGVWLPGTLPTSVPSLPTAPVPGLAPSVFGATTLAGSMAFSGNHTAFFTAPWQFATGAAVNSSTGQFDAAAAAVANFMNVDAVAQGLGLVGRFISTGTTANTATGAGVIGRDGINYTLSLPVKFASYLVGGTPDAPVNLYIEVESTLTAIANILAGDVNFDGKVDLLDVQTVGGHWRETNAAKIGVGDANGDGKVDLVDIQVVGGNWNAGSRTAQDFVDTQGGSQPSAFTGLSVWPNPNLAADVGVEPVPEPGTIAIWCGLAACFLGWRWQRKRRAAIRG